MHEGQGRKIYGSKKGAINTFYTSKFNCGKFSLTKGDNYNIYLNAKLIDEATYENVFANVFTMLSPRSP